MSSRVQFLFQSLLVATLISGLLACDAAQTSVSQVPETPFKLATYDDGGTSKLGLVLDERILDIQAANAHLTNESGLEALSIPNDMRTLIEGYERLRPRLYQLANFFSGKTDGLAFAIDAGDASIEAPIQYPWNLLAAAANYRDHAAEMGTEAQVDPDRDAP